MPSSEMDKINLGLGGICVHWIVTSKKLIEIHIEEEVQLAISFTDFLKMCLLRHTVWSTLIISLLSEHQAVSIYEDIIYHNAQETHTKLQLMLEGRISRLHYVSL